MWSNVTAMSDNTYLMCCLWYTSVK